MSTAVEQKQDEGVEEECEHKCIEYAQSALNTVINNVEDGVDQHSQMDDEELEH